MMLMRVTLLLGAWACAVSAVEPSTSPDVFPSVSFLDLAHGWSYSSQEKDIAAVFNKVAHSVTSPTTPASTTPAPSVASRPPPPPLIPVTPPSRRRPSTPATEAPVTRARLKTPARADFVNVFASKDILRGSHNDASQGTHKRPPPPVLPKVPPPEERIPYRPPDLPVRHQPLNTPARGGDGKDAAPAAGQRHNDPHNETEVNFVPILKDPAVSRILSSSSGRKEPDQTSYELEKFFSIPRPTTSTTTTSTTPSTTTSTTVQPELEIDVLEEETDEPSEVPDVDNELGQQPDDERLTQGEDYELQVWRVAWNVHVYLMGSLFLLLVLVCASTWLRRGGGRVLSPLYLHLSNGLLMTVGVLRAIFLLHDAYNRQRSYPEALAPVLLHFALPLLCLCFALLFLFVAKFTRTQLLSFGRNALVFAVSAAVTLVVCCLGLQLAAGMVEQPTAKRLLLINQWLLLVWAVALSLTYLAAFPLLSRSLSTLNPMFSTTQHVPPASLGLVLRSLLAVAMLLLLLVCVHLYGVFGVVGLFGDQPPRLWPWWGFHFSVRVIEVSISLLMAFVAALKVPSPVKKALKDRVMVSQDLYPAVCGANYAVQKKLYEDPYQLRTLVAPPAPMLQALPVVPLPAPVEHPSDRPSSMLFAEDGIVRFRTSADPEQPMEEVLHRTMSRNGGVGVPGPRPPIPHPRWVGHFHHPSDSDFTDESAASSASSSGGSRHPRGPSEDVSPDSAVGSDIYSKNGDVWRDENLTHRIMERLVNLHGGYSPLAYPPYNLASPTAGHCNIYARPDDESAV